MDVTLLWFQCKNPDCNYVPVKTKKEKIKRYWKHGLSLESGKRPRRFMRYVEGTYRWVNELLLYECKYGTILMHNTENSDMPVNSYAFPILDGELCQPCQKQMEYDEIWSISTNQD